MKNADKCIEDCQKAIEVGKANRAEYETIAKAYVRMGNAKRQLKDLEGQKECYEKAQLEHHTRDIEKKLKLEAKERGNAFFKEAKFPESVREYDEAIKRDPKNPVYYANRAASLTKLMNFMDAKRDCERALDLDPTYVKAYVRKGAVEFFMKEYKQALDSYNEGLKHAPD